MRVVTVHAEKSYGPQTVPMPLLMNHALVIVIVRIVLHRFTPDGYLDQQQNMLAR